jgi:hypothetical protein
VRVELALECGLLVRGRHATPDEQVNQVLILTIA